MSSVNLQILKKQLFERQNKFAHLRREYELLLEQFETEQRKMDASVASFTASIEALDGVRERLQAQLEEVQGQQKELQELRDMETATFYNNHNLPTNFFSPEKNKGDMVIRDSRGLIRNEGDIIRDTKHARELLMAKSDSPRGLREVPKSGLYRKENVKVPYVG